MSDRQFESADIETERPNVFDILKSKRAVGEPRYKQEHVDKYLQNFNQYIKYPYSHHIGKYEELEDFDTKFNRKESGLLATADKLRTLEMEGKESRQKLTDICYMAGVPVEHIPVVVGHKWTPAKMTEYFNVEQKRKEKEIAAWKKRLGEINDAMNMDSTSIFKFNLEAPEHIECTKKVREYERVEAVYKAGNNVIKPQYDEEISKLKDDLASMHALEGELQTDLDELRLREARMDKIVPAVNCFGAWLAKDNAINLNAQARSIGNSTQYVKREAGFERRYEPEGMDPFWETMDAPWEHSIGESFFGPTVEEVREFRQKEMEEEEERIRNTTTILTNTAIVEEEEETPIVFAEKPLLISFGDPRALRPVYMPSAGTQPAALSNAFHHIGVDLENVVDGNGLFFGDMKAISESDGTKMELLRRILLEQLLVKSTYPDEGGKLEETIDTIKRPAQGGNMTLIMETFARHERLERDCIEKYKLPTQNTYLYERKLSEMGQAEGDFPPYIENFEVWFGDKLPPMENSRRRFGFYDVRKRSKKSDNQTLLWMGVMFVRDEDVNLVKQILTKEVGGVKPLFEDDSGIVPKRFALANIVGRAKQRRWADAFVRMDVEREGSLPSDKIFDIIRGQKVDHGLEIKVSIESLESRWVDMFPDIDPVCDQLSYADFEEFVMDVSESFEKESEESEFFLAARKKKLRDMYEDQLIDMFNRYDWNKNGDLEVKEVFGILGELQFSDIDAEMVEALVDQYDGDGDGSIDAEEFLELAIDALLTLNADTSLMGSIYSYFNSAPKISIGVERVKKRRVALWFDESDAANNDLAEVDLSPLGEVDVLNGFEVMCRAADLNVNRTDRSGFYDDKFRMEMVRMLFAKAFIYVDRSSNKQVFGENTNVSLDKQLSSIGEPDGCLSKEAFMGAIRDYKLKEAKLAEFKRPPMGTRNLLEKFDGEEDLWKDVSMHLKFCDLIDVHGNDDVIAPSPKSASRFDMYTCRPEDIKSDDAIQWILIVFNEDSDISYLSENYGQHMMET